MIISVKYVDSDGVTSSREYHYESKVEDMKVGEIIEVPVRSITSKAIVSRINVDESEVEAFKDKLKVIERRQVPMFFVAEED